MITGQLKNQIDKIWDDMYSYGIANPLVAIEQLTYLFFIKMLDDVELQNESKAALLGTEPERIFPTDGDGQLLRWSRFSKLKAEEMFSIIGTKVFPFIKKLNPGKKSAYARYMKKADFTLPNALITEKVVTAISNLSLENRDMKGDLYEYMISKLQMAGRIGQFRTPRHIIRMMVRIAEPALDDFVADPACGTGGFIVGAGEFVQSKYGKELRTNKKVSHHFQNEMFTGYDTDQTMLRITAMNAKLHGMDNADIEFRDSLSKGNTDVDKYTLILANPPFKGSLDKDEISPNLTSIVSTTKTELLFLALFIRMLDFGGRCACIVPDGVLFGSSNAHKAIRKELIDNHKLQAVISMPSGVFKPYAGVSTAVLVFTKTGTGGTDKVWFYDMKSDGFSLDDKREDLGTGGDIEDIVTRYHNLKDEENRQRTEQSFLVPADEIRENGYDLSINRYKAAEYAAEQYPPTSEIMTELFALDAEAAKELDELRKMIF